jgi:superfamily II DNA or RNA helicase
MAGRPKRRKRLIRERAAINLARRREAEKRMSGEPLFNNEDPIAIAAKEFGCAVEELEKDARWAVGDLMLNDESDLKSFVYRSNLRRKIADEVLSIKLQRRMFDMVDIAETSIAQIRTSLAVNLGDTKSIENAVRAYQSMAASVLSMYRALSGGGMVKTMSSRTPKEERKSIVDQLREQEGIDLAPDEVIVAK